MSRLPYRKPLGRRLCFTVWRRIPIGAPAPADRGGGGEPCAQGRGPGAGFGGSHLRAFSVSASGQDSCGRARNRARSGAAAPKRAAAGDAPALRHTLLFPERGAPSARCLGGRDRPLRPSEIETPSKSRCCCCRGSRRAVTRSSDASDAAGAGGGQELFEVAAGACGGVAGCLCRSARKRGDLSSTKAAPGVCAAFARKRCNLSSAGTSAGWPSAAWRLPGAALRT